jgi:hypothetical protein
MDINFIALFDKTLINSHFMIAFSNNDTWFEYIAVLKDLKTEIPIIGGLYYQNKWILYNSSSFYNISKIDKGNISTPSYIIVEPIVNTWSSTYTIITQCETNGDMVVVVVYNNNNKNNGQLCWTNDLINLNVSAMPTPFPLSSPISTSISLMQFDSIWYFYWNLQQKSHIWKSTDGKIFSDYNNVAIERTTYDGQEYGAIYSSTYNSKPIFLITGCTSTIYSDREYINDCGFCTIFQDSTICTNKTINSYGTKAPVQIISNGKISLGVNNNYPVLNCSSSCMLVNIVGQSEWNTVNNLENIEVYSNIIYKIDTNIWLFLGLDHIDNKYKIYTSTDGLTWKISNEITKPFKFIIYHKSSSIPCSPVCSSSQTCNNTTGKCIDNGSGGGGNDNVVSTIPWLWIGIGIGILSILLIIYVNVIKKLRLKIKD